MSRSKTAWLFENTVECRGALESDQCVERSKWKRETSAVVWVEMPPTGSLIALQINNIYQPIEGNDRASFRSQDGIICVANVRGCV